MEKGSVHRECRRFGPRHYDWVGGQPECLRKSLWHWIKELDLILKEAPSEENLSTLILQKKLDW